MVPPMKPALLGIVLSFALAAPAAAETFTVQPDGGACASGGDTTCGTISDAVAEASGADTINVAAGTYTENVDIPGGKDELTIAGAGIASVVQGVIDVASDDVEVSAL